MPEILKQIKTKEKTAGLKISHGENGATTINGIADNKSIRLTCLNGQYSGTIDTEALSPQQAEAAYKKYLQVIDTK